MKTILKHFIIDTASLYLISLAVKGMVFESGIQTILLTGAVLALATLIIRPVLNILIMPINLITFGLFKWVTYVITFYLVTVVVPGFKILEFAYAGYRSVWFVLPAVHLTGILALIAFAFLISFVSAIVYWILK